MDESPLPTKTAVKTMKFGEALDQTVAGQKITRLGWDDKEIFGYLSDQMILSITKGGVETNWLVSEGDIISEDWVTL